MTLLKTFNRLAFLPLFTLLAFTACANTPFYPLVIHSGIGEQKFQVEMVNTPETMAQGLMYRKSLAEGYGMLFLFGDEQMLSFWMKNTLIPLDMLFIKKNGQIASIHEMAQPHDETGISSGSPVSAVLEIAGGEVAKRGIKAGDMVETSFLQGQK